MPCCRLLSYCLLPALLALSGTAASGQSSGPALARKPNLLLLYSDDHGWADLGIQGGDPHLHTPHLDQLARDGLRFSRGLVCAPQCMPSRAGVMTGRYPQRFGLEDNRRGPLPLAEITLAERLKPAGYLSGFVGKSHLDIGGEGGPKATRLLPTHLPQHQGFDEYFRGELKSYHASHDLAGQPLPHPPQLIHDPRFRVEVQTEAALGFLKRRAAKPEQPWLLYLAWYAPHVPLESPQPWFDRTPSQLPLPRRQALAMMACMDEGLGRLRAALKSMGQEQDTLIFFIGDNGAPLGKSWNGSLNEPMKGQKGMLSEGGIRVPFLGAWPGHWPAGKVIDEPVINLDVAATINALAGLPADPRLDGINLHPQISRQGPWPKRQLFWRWGGQAAVLEMPYKLIQLGSQPPLLFDVSQPGGENAQANLASSQPQILQRLKTSLQTWAAQLKPAGLQPEESGFTRHHQDLFAEHGLIKPIPAKPPLATSDPMQGWIARSANLKLRDGGLELIPESPAKPGFYARAGLDLQGPLQLRLTLRAKDAGKGRAQLTWRSSKESFLPHQAREFVWPQGEAWQVVELTLPQRADILHLRLNPPQNSSGIAIRRIEIQDDEGKPHVFDFSTTSEVQH